jgi:hypothetical protein
VLDEGRVSSVCVQEFRSSGVQEFRSSGVQEFRSSGVQEFRSSGVQGGRRHRESSLPEQIFPPTVWLSNSATPKLL